MSNWIVNLNIIIFIFFPDASQNDKKETDQPNHEISINDLYNQHNMVGQTVMNYNGQFAETSLEENAYH